MLQRAAATGKARSLSVDRTISVDVAADLDADELRHWQHGRAYLGGPCVCPPPLEDEFFLY